MQLIGSIISISCFVAVASFGLLAIDAVSEWSFPSSVTWALAHGVALGLMVCALVSEAVRRR